MGELIGRMHPLLVHFPIGVLVLAGLAGLLLKGESYTYHRSILRMAYLIGTLFAGASVLTGLYMTDLASYEESNVWWHKWSGISIMGVGFLLFWQSKQVPSKFIFPILNAGILLLLTFTGHLGGRMTHGPDYLLPKTKTVDSIRPQVIDDSTMLFTGLVLPVLQTKCIRCHQKDAKNGGLDLSTHEALIAGSDGDPVIEAGHANKSELFKRVSLPANHPQFMPPNGPGLTYDEVRLLEWWIETGASPDKKIGDLVRSSGIEEYLERKFGLRTKGNDPLAEVSAPEVSLMVMDSVKALGFNIKRISSRHNALDVVPQKPNQPLTTKQLTSLLTLKEQIVWLNLAGTNLSDESLQIIGQLRNLRKLHLERNPISDKGMINMEGLVNLEYLNIFGTGVGDQAVSSLSKLTKLKELFIGQTYVTESGFKTIQELNPKVVIVGNMELFDKTK